MDSTPPIQLFGFVADPNNSNVVYIGGKPLQPLPHCNNNGGRIFKGDASQPSGTEPGAQWTALCCDGANGTSPHPDSRSLVFDDNGNLINTNDGGIYRFYFNPPAGRPELKNQWVFASGNLRDTEFYSVAYDSVAHVIFGGTQDNGSPEQNGQGNPQFTDQSGG